MSELRPQSVTLIVQEALRRGMESLSQAEVGSALQVYFNLGQLRQVRWTALQPPVNEYLRLGGSPLTIAQAPFLAVTPPRSVTNGTLEQLAYETAEALSRALS